ncbi:hypothetical protein BASA81_004095 [Batrachochytrium salamandrivorans]|nr:hypothetical protein BASA81_004095 [Batrachochytrium salamandrivorans]
METNQNLEVAERAVKRFPKAGYVKGVQRAQELRTVLEDLFAMQATLSTSICKKLRRGKPRQLDCSTLNGEQIWLMLQLWQSPLETWLEGMAENLADFDLHLLQGGEDEEDEEDEIEEEDMEDPDFDEDGDLDDFEEDGEGFGEDFDDDDEEGALDVLSTRQQPKATMLADPLLDDELFRVSEMDSFADKMELQLMKDRESEEEDEEDESEEDDDNDDLDSYDSQDEDEENKKFIRHAMFQAANQGEDDDGEEDMNVRFDDFFGPPTSGKSASNTAAAVDKPLTKRQVIKNDLLSRIKQLEEEAMSDKPWETKGEIKASSRPKDSLLDKQDVLDVDFLKRTTPALSAEVAKDIDQYILKRVLEGRFDDRMPVQPVKEFDPSADTTVLSKERSKEGLGDTYARAYEEQVLHHKPKDQIQLEAAQVEIKELFEALCQKLDSLSNLVYTPKPPPSKNKDSNRPADIAAIHMEDIVPTTEAGGMVNQVAPEELERRAVGLGKSAKELEPQDRKALRRRNKEAAKKRKGPTTIIPQRTKRIKVQEATVSNDRDAGKQGTDWTSSAQVFRRIEASRQ